MEIQELRDKSSALKIQKQSFLNDTFFWVKLAREAVGQLPDTRFEFEVPKAGKKSTMRMVARNNGIKVKERIINKDIYNSAFVSIVAAIEDYLSKTMTWILLCDNQRIKCTISGINFTKDISIIELINQDKDALITKVIDQRVEALFYASPAKQLEYFDKALGIELEDDIWGRWIEIKARRDLWIHNAGVVNSVYIKKADKYKLCEINDIALVSESYFKNCIAILKTMLGQIDREIRKTYKE